jgi:glycerol transport system substrate-binding protein
VPDYPRLSQLWWQNISQAITGEATAQEALDNLAEQQDGIMERLERANLPVCGPIMNELRDAEYWLNQPGSPKPEREPEAPIAVPYDELLRQWTGE